MTDSKEAAERLAHLTIRGAETNLEDEAIAPGRAIETALGRYEADQERGE
jgi:hypothetical protein